MKIIKLVPALELGNKLNVDVMDFPGAPDIDLPAGAGVLTEAMLERRSYADPQGSRETGASQEGGAHAEVGAPPEGGASAKAETSMMAGATSVAGASTEARSFGLISDTCRKRCGITLEYAPRDIRDLEARGLDRVGMQEYYRQRIYDLVKINISQDWACCGGMDEVMDIVMKHMG